MKILENMQIVPAQAAGPADINSAGVTGDYVSMANFERLVVLIYAGDGTAGGDLSATLYQAQDNGGTGAKVLSVLETGRIYTKNHASTFAGVGQWTKVTQATASETYTDATSGEQVNCWALEVKASDLDADNDFSFVRVDLADPGASKIVGVLYLLGQAKYPNAPESVVSALA